MKPTVTELIGMLDKPALMKWANKIGLEGVSLDEYRAKSQKRGTSYHKQIEDFIMYHKAFEDTGFQARFEQFISDKTIIASEKSFTHALFCGRMDFKFCGPDKVVYIADFKSNQRSVYLENKLQLVAYRMAEGCDKVAIISIPDMAIIPVPILDFAPYERFLTLLSELYRLKKQL